MRQKPSDRTLAIGTMFRLAPEDVNMARLLATECSDIEAYLFTHETEDSLSDSGLKSRASRYLSDHPSIRECADWFNSAKIKADSSTLMRVKKGSKKNGKVGVYSKDDALSTVNQLIVGGRLTDKEKLAAIDLLNKLQQWNKEDDKDDVELVHFYLPLTCKRCSLYVESRKSKQV
jgi:hypothetical protein